MRRFSKRDAITEQQANEPMTAPTFRASVSMAVWLIALCVAVLTITAVVRGWPSESSTPAAVSIPAPADAYLAIPPCGWSQVSAARPGEPSVSVATTCDPAANER